MEDSYFHAWNIIRSTEMKQFSSVNVTMTATGKGREAKV